MFSLSSPQSFGGTFHVSPHNARCRTIILFLGILLFGFFYKNRSAKRTRRPNAPPAHTHRQHHSDRLRLRKQHLGRATRGRRRKTSNEFSGTDREHALLT